jgi:hypothetical protein
MAGMNKESKEFAGELFRALARRHNVSGDSINKQHSKTSGTKYLTKASTPGSKLSLTCKYKIFFFFKTGSKLLGPNSDESFVGSKLSLTCKYIFFFFKTGQF